MKDLVSLPVRNGEGVLVVVETPAGSRVKLKLDPELGHVTVSRPLPLGLHYPFDWGFIPSTKAEDGDPLDVLIWLDEPTFPGCLVTVRPVAVFWPLVISKALIGGGSHALSWMSESLSPVMTAGQQTTSIATTVASGGSAASVQAGSRGLASRPSGSPLSS